MPLEVKTKYMNINQDKILKTLEEPVIIEFTESVQKIRKNIILSSFISLFITIGGVQIDPESTFFGLKFSDLSNELIYNGLLIILIYLLIHFLWRSYDTLQEWEVRVTGAKGAFKRADINDIDEAIHPSYPSDPRNSTLYYWWATQAKKIASVRDDISSSQDKLLELENVIHQLREDKKENLSRDTVNISLHVHPIKEDWHSIKNSIDAIEKTLTATQLIKSLATFDRRYKYFLRSQNFRWIIIDFALPFILASFAISKIVSPAPLINLETRHNKSIQPTAFGSG